jgi:hypothetical protein
VKPSGWWFVVGALVMAVGIGGSVVWFGAQTISYINELADSPRIAIGTTEEVSLEAGDYFVFQETSMRSGFGAIVDIQVEDPSGTPVVVRNPGAEFTYETGGESGEAVAEFTARQAGNYTVTVDGGVSGEPGGGLGAFGAVFVAPSPLSLGVVFVASAAIGSLSFIIGLTILIVVGVKRSRRRKAQLAATTGWGPPGGPGGPPQSWGPPHAQAPQAPAPQPQNPAWPQQQSQPSQGQASPPPSGPQDQGGWPQGPPSS